MNKMVRTMTSTQAYKNFKAIDEHDMKRLLCTRCSHPTTTCYCHTLQSVTNDWPVLILQHPNEAKHALGTARIAALSLTNCQLFTATAPENSPTLLAQLTVNDTLVVYPSADAIELSELLAKQPIAPLNHLQPTTTPSPYYQLLFLDGTWRKTRRMLCESPLLQQLPKLTFTPNQTQLSRYRIRKAPSVNYLSTVESIALVLERLEKNVNKYQGLLSTQAWMVEKQISAMGPATYGKNYTAQNEAGSE